jgi:hypothetical protein
MNFLNSIPLFARRERNVASEPFHAPYKQSNFNDLYNLLFCDNRSLFMKDVKPTFEVLRVVLYDPPDRARLEQIGDDPTIESRYRMLAFYRLRSMNLPVAPKRLLGTIVECQQPLGLDALASYVDGRVRYINQGQKIAVYEPPGPADVAKVARAVAQLSQTALDQFPLSDLPREPRRSPPVGNRFRITFLASDGPYVAEAPYAVLIKDRLAGPVVGCASVLLNVFVQTALKEGKPIPQITMV